MSKCDVLLSCTKSISEIKPTKPKMKRTKEIGGKLLKYAEEKIQERSEKTTKRLKKYAKSLNEVSSELMYSSTIMAGHKKIVID